METVRLRSENIASCVERAVTHLSAGGVVLFPTDTLYGLGADAVSNEAVDKIYAIKGRDEGKPIHAIVSDLHMAAQYGEITNEVRALAEVLPKGKVTFICKKKPGLTTGIARDIETFGFRIPDNDFCIAMVTAFGKPITATSANRSGLSPEHSVDAVLAQLGAAAENLGLVIDAGALPPSPPSSVVNFAGDRPRILREGAVSAVAIEAALRRAA